MKARILQGLGAVAIGLVAVAPAADATVVERGHYSDEYAFSYDDCGFEVAVEGTASGHFRIRKGKGVADTAFFVGDNFSYTETHTNAVSGAFITITGNAIFNEVNARRVEGTIFEFRAVAAGQPFVVYDSAGNLLLRDRGSIQDRALLDTLGDDDPHAEVVEFLGSDVHGPHPGFLAGLCDIITPLIGP